MSARFPTLDFRSVFSCVETWLTELRTPALIGLLPAADRKVGLALTENFEARAITFRRTVQSAVKHSIIRCLSKSHHSDAWL